MVIHAPPCISKLHFSEIDCFSEGPLPFYPYHSMNEVFYNEEMDSFTVCPSEENRKCSNQFGSKDAILTDHTFYFGVEVGGEWKKP